MGVIKKVTWFDMWGSNVVGIGKAGCGCTMVTLLETSEMKD